MERNFSSKSVVLTYRRLGEKNTLVKLFTQQFGIVDVIAYGAQSVHSRLRVVNSVATIGDAYLYMRKNRSLNKLSEFSPDRDQTEARGSIYYFLYASLWAETLIATFGSGSEYQQSFALLHAGLVALRGCDTESHYVLATARFLWRYLHINGISPDITRCAKCDTALREHAHLIAAHSRVYCEPCYDSIAQKSAVYATGMRKYPARLIEYFIQHGNTPFAQIVNSERMISMQGEIFSFIMFFIQQAIGRELKSLPVIQALGQR